MINNTREIASTARQKLIMPKEKSKLYYDRFINPIDFKMGDKVWLIKEPKPGKLEKDHYQGPFDTIKVNKNKNVIIDYKAKAKTVDTNKLNLVNNKE